MSLSINYVYEYLLITDQFILLNFPTLSFSNL